MSVAQCGWTRCSGDARLAATVARAPQGRGTLGWVPAENRRNLRRESWDFPAGASWQEAFQSIPASHTYLRGLGRSFSPSSLFQF